VIPRIIHFTVSPNPTPAQEACIRSAKELHPDWEVRVWQDPVAHPGFRLMDYYKKANCGAQRADLIRLDVINALGGIYLDSDVLVHKNLVPLIADDNFYCSEDGRHLTNAVFGAEAAHSTVSRLIDDLLRQEPDWSKSPALTTGPAFFARVLQCDQAVKLLPRDTFYPYNWNEDPVPPLESTYATHQWAGSWISDEAKHQNKPIRRAKRLRQRIKSVATRFLKPLEERMALAVSARFPKAGVSYSFGQDLIAQTSRGLFMSLPGSDISITPEIALKGTYQEPEARFLDKVLRGGDFAVDVGCNIGTWALVAAKNVGNFGRVYAIDADPSVLQHLRRSLVMNSLQGRAIVLNNAVGAEGDANAEVNQRSLHSSAGVLDGGSSIRVSQVSLDRLFPVLHEIKVLKIDVRGLEHAVLAGASRLIQNRCVRYVLMKVSEEISPSQHDHNISAVNTLVKKGYGIFSLTDEGELQEAENLAAAIGGSRHIVLARNSPALESKE